MTFWKEEKLSALSLSFKLNEIQIAFLGRNLYTLVPQGIELNSKFIYLLCSIYELKQVSQI